MFLSNGPGDPAPLTYAIDNAKALVDSNVPVFGICLGHQILGLAMGGKTFKLKKVKKSVAPGKTAKVKLKLKRPSDASIINAALGGKVKAALQAKFKDAAGNSASGKAKVKLLPKA